MDSVQKHNNCINIPSSQTLKLRYVIQEHPLFSADYTALYLRRFNSSETFNLKNLHLFYAGNLNILYE
jgi:hypothetical protein